MRSWFACAILALALGVGARAQAKTGGAAASATDAPSAQRDIVERIDVAEAPSAPAATPAAEGDTVERIDDSGPATATAAVAPEARIENEERLELSGWARQSLEVFFRDPGYRSAAPKPADLPRDMLVSRSQLLLRARYARGRSFEAVVSGFLGYSLREQGPSRAGVTFDGFNGQAVRGDLEPRLDELSVGFFTRAVDVRLGQQRVAWGRADLISPNDVVNPRDLRDPLTSEVQLRYLASPLARVDVDLSPISVQALFAPVFTPDRFDLWGTNWAALQSDSPASYRAFVRYLVSLQDPTLEERALGLLQQTQLPRSDFRDPSAGLKLAWSAGPIDVSHYYYYSYDGTPKISVNPAFRSFVDGIDFTNVHATDFVPVLAGIDAGVKPFSAVYVRRHHLGLDASLILGSFALRFDGAYDSARVFYRASDFSSFVSPTLQSVLSLEYQTGDVDKAIIAEVTHLYLSSAPDTRLLGYRRTSVGGGLDARWPLFGLLHASMRALLGAYPRTYVLEPELSLHFERVKLSLGTLVIGGENASFGGHFTHNDEIFTKCRYTF